MRKCLQTALLTVIFLLFGATTAPAQTYNLVADSTQLAPSGGQKADVQCIEQLSSGTFVFFNSDAGGIYTWDGSLNEHTSSSSLNSNIGATSNTIDRCDAVETDGSGTVYFSFRASGDSNQPNYIYKTDASNPGNNSFKELDGILGLAFYNSNLYLASYAFFDDTGNREDGIYSISPDLSGSPSEVSTNADLSIDGGIDVSSNGVLYSYSNSFAGGNFAKKIVSLDVTVSGATFRVFQDPYFSGSPLTSGGENIEDVDIVTSGGSEYIVVHNQNPNASNGEEFAAIDLEFKALSLLFTGSDLVNNLSKSSYSAAFSRSLTVNSSGEVTVVSQGGGLDYIATVSDAPPLPVEMVSFDAAQTGSSVTLTWKTASETNNAGFRVQQQTERGWTSLGFVDSKATGGTTTEAQSYRFDVEDLSTGTHQFRLKQEDLDGTTSLSDVVSVDLRMQDAVSLSAPAPNPVRQQGTISFAVKEKTTATVSLFNTLGQKVATLYQGTPTAGEAKTLSLSTDGLPSGLYLVRLQADGQTRTQRVTVVK